MDFIIILWYILIGKIVETPNLYFLFITIGIDIYDLI